jgi:hypothetical protein
VTRREYLLLCTSDPHRDRGIKNPNRLLGYDLNITAFLILLELCVYSSDQRFVGLPDTLQISHALTADFLSKSLLLGHRILL